MKIPNNYIKKLKTQQTQQTQQTQPLLCNHNRYYKCNKCNRFFNISSLYRTGRGYYCSFCIYSRD